MKVHPGQCFNVLLTFLAITTLEQGVDGLKDSLKCPMRVLKGGRVRLRSKDRVAKYVCLRGAQVLGERYSMCIRGKWDTPVPICINTGCLPVVVSHGQVLDTYRGALVTVHCDPGYALVGSQSIYCNGAVWNDTAPTCREIKVRAQKSCDFENEDLCGWTHDQNHDFDWRRHNFATPSGHVGTGPSFDHTLGSGLNGHYMYLEVSSPRLENDTARLFSPVFDAVGDSGSCFIFWYHMYGITTGTLNVYLHKQNTVLLFSKTGDQGNKWLQAVVSLPQINSRFQIVIEGVRGSGYEGDIAIDDVKITEGEECLVFTSSTSSDMGIVIDESSSSCGGRCLAPATDPSMCECTPDCISNNTCCPDYVQLCSTGLSEAKFGDTTEKLSTHFMEVQTKAEMSKIPLNSTAEILVPTQDSASFAETSSKKLQDVEATTFRNNISTVVISSLNVTIALNTTSAATTVVSSFNWTTGTESTMTTHVPKQLVTENVFNKISNVSAVAVTNTPKAVSVTTSPKAVSVTTSPKAVSVTTTPKVVSVTITPKATNQSVITMTSKTTPATLENVPITPKLTITSVKSTPSNKTPSVNVKQVIPTTPKVIKESIKTTKKNLVTAVPTTSSRWGIRYKKFPPFPTINSTSTNRSSVVRRPKIEFVTPPPPVVFRTPTSSTRSTSKSTQHNISYEVTPLWITRNTKKPLSKTKKVTKSKNNIFHPVWFQNSSTTEALPPLGPKTGAKKTSSAYLVTSQPSTWISHQPISSQTTTGARWRSKYKPRDEAPVHAHFARPSPPPGKTVHILVLVAGVLLVIVTTTATICALRRRKINRRRMEDDELDIQFLASDEILDFTLARPSMEDIQMKETRTM